MGWAEKLPSGKYRAVYRDAAGRRRSAGTFTHKPKAVRAANAKELEVRKRARRDPDAWKQTWGKWADTWWASRSVEASTKKTDAARRQLHLEPRWAEIPLGEITRHDIKAWAAEMREAGVGPETVKRIVHLFSASLSSAVDAEILDSNPAVRLKLPGGEQSMERYLTREEYQQIRDQLPTSEDQLIADLLAYTGMRWGELAGLHWHRVNLLRRQIRVTETYVESNDTIKAYPKGRQIRDVPLVAHLIEPLGDPAGREGCGVQHAIGECRSSLVVTTERGRPLRNSNWSDRVWRPAVKASGVGHVRIHDLRHTYASWLLQAGVSLAEVGRLLGHVSPQTTARYAHLAETPWDEVRQALDPQQDREDAPRKPHGDSGEA